MARIFFRDTFQPTDRPPYKELPLPVAAYFPEYIAVSEVVEYVNIVFLHGSFHNAISAILPDIVVGAYASQAFFPEPCPLGPVVIKEMNRIVLRVFRNPGLYGVPIGTFPAPSASPHQFRCLNPVRKRRRRRRFLASLFSYSFNQRLRFHLSVFRRK